MEREKIPNLPAALAELATELNDLLQSAVSQDIKRGEGSDYSLSLTKDGKQFLENLLRDFANKFESKSQEELESKIHRFFPQGLQAEVFKLLRQLHSQAHPSEEEKAMSVAFGQQARPPISEEEELRAVLLSVILLLTTKIMEAIVSPIVTSSIKEVKGSDVLFAIGNNKDLFHLLKDFIQSLPLANPYMKFPKQVQARLTPGEQIRTAFFDLLAGQPIAPRAMDMVEAVVHYMEALLADTPDASLEAWINQLPVKAAGANPKQRLVNTILAIIQTGVPSGSITLSGILGAIHSNPALKLEPYLRTPLPEGK